MSKEVLLYGQIHSETSVQFITALEEIKNQDFAVRINGEGGSPEYAWGMIAKFSEMTGKKMVKVDGQAHSMLMFFLCYADDSEALDVAEFLVHRAAYPAWYESNAEYFNDAMRGNIERVNLSLRKAFEAKIDVAKFEALPQCVAKKIKVKDIFSLDSRIEVFLTAADAKKIGLIDRVVKITPAKQSEINTNLLQVNKGVRMAAAVEIEKETEIENEPNKIVTMNLQELKEKFPAVYAEAVAQGVTKEKDRVEACLVFIDVDQAGVKSAIESGSDLTAKQMAEFALKSASKSVLKKAETDSASAVKTDEEAEPKNATEEKKAAFAKEAMKHLFPNKK